LPGRGHTAAPEAEILVLTKLAGLVALVRKEVRLMNVIQYVDKEMLHLALYSLLEQAAPGIDGRSYEDYEANLERNL